MKKRILSMVFAGALLAGCSAPISVGPAALAVRPQGAPSRASARNDPFAAADNLPDIPSLTARINGRDVVLINMQDPLTRSFYTGCGDIDVSGLEWTVYKPVYDDRLQETVMGEEMAGYIDARYTAPIYEIAGGDTREKRLDIAAHVQAGGRLADLVTPRAEASWEQYSSILFDGTGQPAACIGWGERYIVGDPQHHEFDRLLQYADAVDAVVNYLYNETCFVPTYEIRAALEKNGLDPARTRVIVTSLDISHELAYLFSDGEKEMLFFWNDPDDTAMTAEQYAAYLIAEYAPQQVQTAYFDGRTAGADTRSIKISNGSAYKDVTEIDSVAYILRLLRECGTMTNRADLDTKTAEKIQILFDEDDYCSLYRQGNDYYLWADDVGLCTVDMRWGRRVFALYNNLILEELPQADFEQLRDADEPDDDDGYDPLTGKPVLYLYPTRPTDVAVTLDFDGRLDYTYPAYGGGWSVTAHPDGRLVNRVDGSEHWYLFWEGVTPHRWNLDTGFVVPGRETAAFLQGALAELGLVPREYNDFITYWVPQMQGNAYNLIHFSSQEEYGAVAGLAITPQPDSLLRVHMAWMALDEPVELPPQRLDPFRREGFCAVEWGGTEVLAR